MQQFVSFHQLIDCNLRLIDFALKFMNVMLICDMPYLPNNNSIVGRFK